MVECIERRGVAAVLRGDAERAAQLLAAAARQRDLQGTPLFPYDKPRIDRASALLSEGLGEPALAAAEAAGRKLTLQEAVGLAARTLDR